MMTILSSRERSMPLTSADVAAFMRLNLSMLRAELGGAQSTNHSAAMLPAPRSHRRIVVDAACALVMAILRHRPRSLMRAVPCFVDYLRLLMRVILAPLTAAAAVVAATTAVTTARRASGSGGGGGGGGRGSHGSALSVKQRQLRQHQWREPGRQFTVTERAYMAESWTRTVAAASDLKQAMRRFYAFLVGEYITLSLQRDARVSSGGNYANGRTATAQETTVDVRYIHDTHTQTHTHAHVCCQLSLLLCCRIRTTCKRAFMLHTYAHAHVHAHSSIYFSLACWNDTLAQRCFLCNCCGGGVV